MTDGKLFIDADPDFMVCVNISPEQVTDAYFADSVADLAQEIGFPLNRLCLELSRDCRDLSAEMLRTFAGPIPVYMNLPAEGVTLLAPRDCWCQEGAVNALWDCLSPDDIRLVDKREGRGMA